MPNTAQQGRPTEEQFELVVRLQQSRSSQPSDGAARLRAQALVKDILMSKLEVDPEVGARDYVHTRGLSDLGKALAASRALQVAFEGFRRALPSGRANVSVVLDLSAPEEAPSTHAGLSVEQKDLLDCAKPSQVLVTQAFYDKVAHYQPALRSFSLRAGVYEFLWTSEERLNKLQAEAEFMPTLVIDPVPTPARGIVAGPGAGAAPEPSPVEGTWRPRQPRVSEPDDEESAPKLSRSRIIAISSAAVVLISIGMGYLVITHTSLGRQPAPPGSKAQIGSSGPTKSGPKPDAGAGKPPKPPPPVGTDNKTNTPLQSSTPQPAPPKQGGSPVDSPQGGQVRTAPGPKQRRSGLPRSDNGGSNQLGSEPPTKTRGCSIGGEVPAYLGFAERDRSIGKYERAITEYNLVLACDPRNREAREGLQHAKDAQRLSGVLR